MISKTVEQGQIIASSTNNVSGGTVLLQMADLSELEIRTLVDEIDIGDVRPGLRVESTVEAYADMSFEGAVMKIEPQAVVQQSVTTFPVLSRIDNGAGLLLLGMNADVSIIIHERFGVLTVANEAVRTPEAAREVISLLDLDATLPAPTAALDATTGARPVAGQASDSRFENRGAFAADNGDNGFADNGSHASPNGDNGSAYGNGDEATHAAVPAPRNSGIDEDETRRDDAVVFVLRADGSMEARPIVIGVRDWEVSEVIAGLGEGEEVVLLPSNSLLRSQQSMRERFARRNAIVPTAGR